jgi:hypothetical protein
VAGARHQWAAGAQVTYLAINSSEKVHSLITIRIRPERPFFQLDALRAAARVTHLGPQARMPVKYALRIRELYACKFITFPSWLMLVLHN